MPKKRRSSLQTAQAKRTLVHKKIIKSQQEKRAAQSLKTKKGKKFGGTFIPAGFTKPGATKRFDKAERDRARYAGEARRLDKRIKKLGGKRRY